MTSLIFHPRSYSFFKSGFCVTKLRLTTDLSTPCLDMLGDVVRRRHDRHHRVDAAGGRQNAAIGHEQVAYLVALAGRVNRAERRIPSDAAGRHLMGAEQGKGVGLQSSRL